MRVLLVPELYRPTEATANGTLNDAVTWLEEWLRLDETLHAYWLLPPRETANYDASYVLADRERVTLIEAESFMSGHDDEYVFTESGYTRAQLEAISEHIYDRLGYVDIVVDQLRRGRADLYKWLLLRSGHRADQATPFSLIANVHDLQLPFKYEETGYRNEYQRQTEISNAVFSDGIWFKASVDMDGMRRYGRDFMQEDVLDEALESSVRTQSPIDFSRFTETYREAPEVLHIAGSIWRKKHTEDVIRIADRLHEKYGIRTLITSMSDIPSKYADRPWVEAHANASRETFEAALKEGDIAVCASEFETLARTWFEQAASGQVLVIRDEAWIYDCVPEDYGLAADADDLADVAEWVVENWEEAVAENRRMVEYVKSVRDPEVCGRETYEDMDRHVGERLRSYVPSPEGERYEAAVAELDADTVALDDLLERADARRDSASPSLGELVFALRKAGYRDTGNPGTPVFERV